MAVGLAASLLRALLVGATLSPAAGVHSFGTSRGGSLELDQLRAYDFETFVKDFERSYRPGTEEWARREQIFAKSLQEIVGFQSGPARSWKKGITKFMDYSETEYKAVLGYKGRGSRISSPASSMELFGRRNTVELPPSFSLGSQLVGVIRDQGMCGSCWAEAAISVLEGLMETNSTVLAAMSQALNGKQSLVTLSSQALVSCTPNPRNCGGKGGCEGATAELAFEMVQKRGMPLAMEWGYVSGGGSTPQCKDEIFSKTRLGITGYTVLPSNKVNPLKEALYKAGTPIVVSVDATGWSFYSGGVYSDTDGGKPGEFTVNHAVVLTGFADKQADQKGYFLIKNSWGEYWGEKGYIRLEMKDDEEAHCGWDYKTHDGLACDGDPDTAWVCGTCGVLYDSSFPTGPYLMEG